MVRTLIQFDEDTYYKLRRRAFDEKQSISAVVRELVSKGLEKKRRRKFSRIEDFQSVSAGRSKQSGLAPVSESHDEALAEIILKHSKK